MAAVGVHWQSFSLTRGFESQETTRSVFLWAPERAKNPPFAAPGEVPHFLHLRTPVPRMQSSGQSLGSSSIPLPGKTAPSHGKGAVAVSGTDNSKRMKSQSDRSPSFPSKEVREVVRAPGRSGWGLHSHVSAQRPVRHPRG